MAKDPEFVIQESGGQQTFSINLDSDGMGQCGVSPAPLKVIDWTEHHGACLAECAEFQGCSSYNYHYDTHKCELLCIPTNYSSIPNCFHYLVRNCNNCIDNIAIFLNKGLGFSSHFPEDFSQKMCSLQSLVSFCPGRNNIVACFYLC